MTLRHIDSKSLSCALEKHCCIQKLLKSTTSLGVVGCHKLNHLVFNLGVCVTHMQWDEITHFLIYFLKELFVMPGDVIFAASVKLQKRILAARHCRSCPIAFGEPDRKQSSQQHSPPWANKLFCTNAILAKFSESKSQQLLWFFRTNLSLCHNGFLPAAHRMN